MRFGKFEDVIVTLKCDDADEGGKTRFTLRPLTGPQLAEARAAAGSMPWRGKRVIDEVNSAVADTEETARKAAGVDGKTPISDLPQSARDGIGKMCARVQTEAFAELDPADVEAADLAGVWMARLNLEFAVRALVAVDGAAVTDAAATLASVQPASLYASVVSELASHVSRLSETDPKV